MTYKKLKTKNHLSAFIEKKQAKNEKTNGEFTERRQLRWWSPLYRMEHTRPLKDGKQECIQNDRVKDKG